MPRELRDYLSISPAAARWQWLALLARSPAPKGKRQVDFIPVETLMALAATLRVNHRRYGGSTAAQAAEPVPALARLFSRPNSSVLAKMANLDGSRRNGAKHEIEVAERLLTAPGALAGMYLSLLAAAREVGIGPDRLPDFLELEDAHTNLVLLGQDELVDVDLQEALSEEHQKWRSERSDLEDVITERLLVASARLGQHRFAVEVLSNHGHRCVFCGLHVETSQGRASRMLVASHIKPWRVSNASERLDPANGLSACPTHDVAFDTGLLTVNGGLRIHVKSALAHQIATDASVRSVFGRPPLAERLLLPPGARAPKPRYLAWHQENVFVDRLNVGP
ncbi:MAG: HNH endonuclease [Phycicoccus sp.]|nr:HNH endonuclease [Phycicoccus sp.]